MTLEQLLEERNRLAQVMLRGEQSIEFESRRTQFRSYDELKAQLDWLDEQIAEAEGASTFARVRRVSSCKDLC